MLGPDDRNADPDGAEPRGERGLIVFGRSDGGPAREEILPPPRPWKTASKPAPDPELNPPSSRPLRRAAFAATALAVLTALGGTAYLAFDDRHQSALLAERAHENTGLEQTVSTLNARLDALEAAKGRDDLADLRGSVSDMKMAAAASRELGSAIADLAARVEKLDRDEDAKIGKLGERFERDMSARAAEVSARLDKLEKSGSLAAPAAPTAAPTAPAAPAVPTAPAAKLGPGVAMDPTGSIARPRPVLRGYVVLGVEGDVALIGGRYGERPVRAGDYLPGAGRVERVQRQGSTWVVVTDRGLIASAYSEPD